MEKRCCERKQIAINVELHQPGRQIVFGVARDVSTEGLLVERWDGQPEVNEGEVIIRFQIWTGDHQISRRLPAQVVWRTGLGVGVAYHTGDLVTAAVARDLLHYMQYERRSEPRPPAGVESSAA